MIYVINRLLWNFHRLNDSDKKETFLEWIERAMGPEIFPALHLVISPVGVGKNMEDP